MIRCRCERRELARNRRGAAVLHATALLATRVDEPAADGDDDAAAHRATGGGEAEEGKHTRHRVFARWLADVFLRDEDAPSSGENDVGGGAQRDDVDRHASKRPRRHLRDDAAGSADGNGEGGSAAPDAVVASAADAARPPPIDEMTRQMRSAAAAARRRGLVEVGVTPRAPSVTTSDDARDRCCARFGRGANPAPPQGARGDVANARIRRGRLSTWAVMCGGWAAVG